MSKYTCPCSNVSIQVPDTVSNTDFVNDYDRICAIFSQLDNSVTNNADSLKYIQKNFFDDKTSFLETKTLLKDCDIDQIASFVVIVSQANWIMFFLK
jgi:hypothetical protein